MRRARRSGAGPRAVARLPSVIGARQRLGGGGGGGDGGSREHGGEGGELQRRHVGVGGEGHLLVRHAAGLAERGGDHCEQAEHVGEHLLDAGKGQESGSVHGDGAERPSEEYHAHGQGDGHVHPLLGGREESEEQENASRLEAAAVRVSEIQ